MQTLTNLASISAKIDRLQDRIDTEECRRHPDEDRIASWQAEIDQLECEITQYVESDEKPASDEKLRQAYDEHCLIVQTDIMDEIPTEVIIRAA